MPKIINEHILDADENYIVIPMPISGDMSFNSLSKINQAFPHVHRECLKYLRYCSKKNIDPRGSIQFIPAEVWALTMVDTIKNTFVPDYDSHYQYIVPVYCCREDRQIDATAFAGGIHLVAQMAEENNASIAISMPGNLNSLVIQNVSENVFKGTDLSVVICKHK